MSRIQDFVHVELSDFLQHMHVHGIHTIWPENLVGNLFWRVGECTAKLNVANIEAADLVQCVCCQEYTEPVREYVHV